MRSYGFCLSLMYFMYHNALGSIHVANGQDFLLSLNNICVCVVCVCTQTLRMLPNLGCGNCASVNWECRYHFDIVFVFLE